MNTIIEENGTVLKKYTLSESRLVEEKRIQSSRWSLRQLLYEAFLPEGYPHSVSADYTIYQVFDSIQALASSFTGTLSTRAILQGVGVGDATATSTAAATQWLIRDGSGMLGRILFGWAQGANLDANAKTWRFMADILNDVAMFLEMMVVPFPSYFLPLVCIGSVLKAIVGVAGGATRAAITQHQARRDNLADVSAKDGSQETALVLLGMLLSLIIMPLVGDSQVMTWVFFALFTVIHLGANYIAVRSIKMEKLNRQRANMVITKYLTTGTVPTPHEVAKEEKIFYFEWMEGKERIVLGASIRDILKNSTDQAAALAAIQAHHKGEKYAVYHSSSHPGPAYILLHHGVTPIDLLKAYFHARTNFYRAHTGQAYASQPEINAQFARFVDQLKARGWNLQTVLLGQTETRIRFAEGIDKND